MPTSKMPIDPRWGSLRGTFPQLSVSSVLPIDEIDHFDFRSLRFGADAHTLVRTTGCSLVLCRQELFIAQGDMAMAHQVLISGYRDEPARPTLH